MTGNGVGRWAKQGLIIAGVTLVTFCGLGEILVRTFGLAPKLLPPLDVGTYQLSPDPVRLFEYKPNYRERDLPFDSQHRGFATNSDGFREREFPLAQHPGITRIVVLGDSIAAGNGITDATALFSRRLEGLLNARSRRKFEVLNLAVGGYDTLQEVETLRDYLPRLRPDLVIVAFCLNDFVPLSDAGVYVRLLHQRLYRSQNKLASFWGDPRLLLDFALLHSKLLLYLSIRVWGVPFNYQRRYFPPDLKRERNELVFFDGKQKRHGETVVDIGFEMLAALQKAPSFAVRVFIFPFFGGSLSHYSLGALHRKVFQAASPYPTIQVIDLLPGFARIRDSGMAFSIDGVHLNPHGHEITAELMAGALLQDP